ncbi:protein FAR1-RELATED SEQUENCE 11-like [Mangifera indica]|uniref:protein FAR1-RELATED SEQUENCE 11-like n=1 Tax=Mangifera indica TaxID=29780 RepID=UPI001CF9A309|nr:protein FAR1-RELATED SEQUENCE 11-like [Mangifera indica]XP_044499856.1 protein FAR1-RELATED SEQUENCE 11-like [Mangifera indica]XP_044499857.1 protein FAR1-RELATED SEQUENCE 11-like [Mangifera indica]XP_044499859.1 protein FAR1-RELATED SEQUENCE 11-like [Mangifera indica]XP_044499860.1 protein FAR1-RELATED SEQUENCE 11-like [Mangifera indica]XP_044499861.1 protein FAR1-RELATED SEQUENCE 11-like [Mangifera indica]XP_044499862.1 protein FAR1-RELATED SEQUENCE 11-like [Mangifera indica]
MSEGTSMASSEHGPDLSQDDTGTIGETPEVTILSQQTSIHLVPFIGQRFVSQDAAYEFYCSFAKQCGFSIRRHRTRGKDGVGRGVTRRDFTCHRGGFPQTKPSDDGKMQRNRKSARCGCQAYMRIVKRVDFDVPEWHVTGFSNIHNHELLKSNEVHLLPAYCTITPDDKTRICMFAKAGMSVRQMLRLMELEKGLKLGCLPFTEIDVRNLLQSFRNVNRDYDATDLILMCKKLKDEDHNFQYDFKIDGHNRLEHIAWTYASSVQLYEAFGDAVIFDTTHRLDCYDLLFGIWVGLDNHGMACFFGCVLLRDENIQSFTWALKTFLGFMKGKAPQTISTDQNIWLKEAVAIEMPATKHAICIWHIISKFSDLFLTLPGSCYDDWKAEFFRLYNLEFEEDFEKEWRKMVNKYGLQKFKPITSLYALRTSWALPFLRHYFFAGLLNMSEAINAFTHRVLSAESQLDRFVERVAEIVGFNDLAEPQQKMQRKQQNVCLRTGSPIESHAASLLTPYAFGKLQEELVIAPQYASLLVDEGCFQVKHHAEMDGDHKVMWIPGQDLMSCSCCQFEFSGILCRHILRVLSTNNCFQIPEQYLPIRWRGVSSSSTFILRTTAREHSEKIQLLESMASTLVSESLETEERLDAANEQIAIVLARIKELPRPTHDIDDIHYTCPSHSLIQPEVEVNDGIIQSFTVGNPHESFTLENFKERRPRDGVDVTRKRSHCSEPYSRQFGQNAARCPIIGSDNLNADALGYL